VERHCDVCIVGGTAADLAAAVQFVRRGWSVIVIDTGEMPEPSADRDELRSYGGEILIGRVSGMTGIDNGDVRIGLRSGNSVVARHVGTDATDAVLAAPRPSANQADWDHRYGGEQMWSGNPNGSLVNEVGGLPPGRALDVGAGEGGDAIWLAEQGWTVTASDISQQALERVRAGAKQRGVEVECLQADANAAGAFPRAAFDLVSAQYASIPRTPDRRAINNILAAVAPGGTLLVVSHDLTQMRSATGDPDSAPAYDPDAYVRVEDFAHALEPGDWDVEVNERRSRPPGSATAAIHAEDVVLRARRRAG
jgi:SAM-dependent methyltransferase